MVAVMAVAAIAASATTGLYRLLCRHVGRHVLDVSFPGQSARDFVFLLFFSSSLSFSNWHFS